jgi:hypothetical protein
VSSSRNCGRKRRETLPIVSRSGESVGTQDPSDVSEGGRSMAMSPHIQRLRAAVGSDLLVLPSVTGIVFDDRDRILLVRQTDGVDRPAAPIGGMPLARSCARCGRRASTPGRCFSRVYGGPVPFTYRMRSDDHADDPGAPCWRARTESRTKRAPQHSSRR